MRLALFSASLLAVAQISFGRENLGTPQRNSSPNQIAAACNAGSSQTDLEINNVRARILTGGDMWWDLQNAKYEVPKGSGDHSLFAGSLWIGGIDAGGQLKVAAMTYRQSGNDYWPGPLDTVSVSIDQSRCDYYDKHYRVNRKEVEDFYASFLAGSPQVPTSMIQWPGNGNSAYNESHYLAPFFDYNGDGVYNPYDGDYPDYDITGTRGCAARLFGDETLWWVFNDKGNIHSESGAEAIGLELHSQAFAFTTNDEVNDMTFYQYKVINRSTYQLNDCYFGQWIDADLGDYTDDYVGCDVENGIGYCYNGDNQDGNGGPGSYGNYIPAIGVDFFQGPLADLGDGKDNDRDCLVDEPGEQIVMSKFIYYNNDWSDQGNPENANHIYGYLSGFWKDGLPLTYGGDAYNEPGPTCDFMFPGTSDQTYAWGTGGNCQQPQTVQAPWDENSVGNTPADRRLLQSAGPFTLKPGAVNTVTVGVVWASTTIANNNMAAIAEMLTADKKAQALFDNCFQVLNGPDAPDITIQELDKELILYLGNGPTSNNYLEQYSEEDPVISLAYPTLDSTFDFEGYQVWQLKDGTVSSSELYNPDKARLVFQCDVKNGITQIVNFEFDKTLNANVPQEMVNGEDVGVSHSVRITDDKFATGDPRLVNHKTYFYMAVSYGYNNYLTYDQNNPQALDGQKQPYKAGRRNIKLYTGIPHIPSPENGGTNQQTSYGVGPKITRIEGNGNGAMNLQLTQSSVDYIMSNADDWRIKTPTYEYSAGPVNVKVVDPLNVPDGNFTLKFSGVASSSNWTLTGPNMTVNSERTINLQVANEQIIPEWGLSVSITQVNNPGVTTDEDMGFITASVNFADPTKQWLTALADEDGYSAANWIRSGTQDDQTNNTCLASYDDYTGQDNDGIYERILGGTWSPYRLTAASDNSTTPPSPCYIGGPCWDKTYANLANWSYLASVDLVITADKSKWTRCVVLEAGDDKNLVQPHPTNTQLNARKLDLRTAASVDKNGNTGDGVVTNDPNDADFIGATGMGWFPGYAINQETGERLNIAFSENSWMAGHNGRDMKWNPTSTVATTNPFNAAVFGGMHYIYIFGHNSNDTNWLPRYDYGRKLRVILANHTQQVNMPAPTTKRNAFRDAMWVNIPMLSNGYNISDPSQIPSDVTVKLRVKKPYKKGYTVIADSINPSQNSNNPMYTFSTTDLMTKKDDNESAENAVDLINIVPNPYYAYSGYEKNQVDTRVKITNLPDKATIKIFTLSGTLIRKLTKDDATITSVDWDLKNTAGIPVASGLYIIHVEAMDKDGNVIGEKILKWFGAMRPADLETY
ncbi:MAG: T9SS C-terminal target domain-containing protein [Bacteroidia bacterium]|nr:T9SS C-terminal target domain-containing protein [Bacteroidia bacterium]